MHLAIKMVLKPPTITKTVSIRSKYKQYSYANHHLTGCSARYTASMGHYGSLFQEQFPADSANTSPYCAMTLQEKQYGAPRKIALNVPPRYDVFDGPQLGV